MSPVCWYWAVFFLPNPRSWWQEYYGNVAYVCACSHAKSRMRRQSKIRVFWKSLAQELMSASKRMCMVIVEGPVGSINVIHQHRHACFFLVSIPLSVEFQHGEQYANVFAPDVCGCVHASLVIVPSVIACLVGSLS